MELHDSITARHDLSLQVNGTLGSMVHGGPQSNTCRLEETHGSSNSYNMPGKKGHQGIDRYLCLSASDF